MIKEELFGHTHNRRKLRKPIIVKVAKANEAIVVSETADINLSYKGRMIQLTNVLCAAQLKCNLLSIKRLEEKGLQVEFRNGSGYVYRGNELIVQTQRGSNLYNITFEPASRSSNYCANLTLSGDQTIWHRCLGHSCTIKPEGTC